MKVQMCTKRQSRSITPAAVGSEWKRERERAVFKDSEHSALIFLMYFCLYGGSKRGERDKGSTGRKFVSGYQHWPAYSYNHNTISGHTLIKHLERRRLFDAEPEWDAGGVSIPLVEHMG